MLEAIVALLFILAPSCETEDDTYCSWNASTQGNGEGRSFVALDEGNRFYVTL